MSTPPYGLGYTEPLLSADYPTPTAIPTLLVGDRGTVIETMKAKTGEIPVAGVVISDKQSGEPYMQILSTNTTGLEALITALSYARDTLVEPEVKAPSFPYLKVLAGIAMAGIFATLIYLS